MMDIKKALLRQEARAKDAFELADKLMFLCEENEETLRMYAYSKVMHVLTTEEDMKRIKALMDKTHASLRKSMECMIEIKTILKDITGRDYEDMQLLHQGSGR